MKRLSALLCTLLLLIAVTPAARADVVWSPFHYVAFAAQKAAPWLLVAALVGITLLLILRFRKKK